MKDIKDIVSLSWWVVSVIALLGIALIWVSFTFFKTAKGDETDSSGVLLSERFGIVLLSGIGLLLLAFFFALLKIIRSF